MSKSTKSSLNRSVRAGQDAISAVKFSQELTATIDAWAEAQQTVRSDAIRRLVELGLAAAPILAHDQHPDSPEIEALAVKQVSELVDPSLPAGERERRIRRLVKGPPEFFGERIDLPKSKG